MQIAENSKPLPDVIREKMEQYRQQLLEFQMLEPTKRESSDWHWLFYKPVTALTAFVINLCGNEYYIEVVYGYASTAFTQMVGNENALIELGVEDKDITIREKFIICDEEDEKTAQSQIQKIYSQYLKTRKDELIACTKEKRREFIQQIAEKLKPLGFRKKTNTWTRALESDYYLMFYVQKSGFSDEYYFNIYIGKTGTNEYGDCYYTRITPDGTSPTDWQAFSKEEFDFFLDRIIVPALNEIIQTPLCELGKLPSFWSGCHCNHQKCSYCWMEKNLWEVRRT